MCGIWFAFLAMGTWILPAGSMLMPTPRAASAAPMTPAPQDGTSAAELAELNAYLNNMLAEGAFDSPAATDARFDLNGDGVNEEIFVDPGDFLAADGRIVVTDGVLHAPRYELDSPPNELCFGEHVALVADCDADGNSELVVASGIQVADGVQLRIRVFSGASGELLGLIKSQHPTQGGVAPISTIHVAGDVNLDLLINTADVGAAVGALGSSSSHEEADLDADGIVTVVDIVKVASKAVDESVTPRAAMLRANLAGIEAVADLLPFPPFITGEPVNSWDCWVNAALLALEFGALLAAITACSASTVTGPAAIACWIGAACLAALFLANLSVHLRDCFVPPQSNMRGEVDSFHTKLLLLCAATGAAGVAWKEILLWLKGFWQIL
jgi:hypothetical protein